MAVRAIIVFGVRFATRSNTLFDRVTYILHVTTLRLYLMRFFQIICTVRNAAGEPKLAVLFATVASVYNVTTAFTVVPEHSEI